MTDTNTNMRLKLPITCFILEIILIILFGVLVEYDEETDAKKWHHSNHSEYDNDFYYRYPSECFVDMERKICALLLLNITLFLHIAYYRLV